MRSTSGLQHEQQECRAQILCCQSRAHHHRPGHERATSALLPASGSTVTSVAVPLRHVPDRWQGALHRLVERLGLCSTCSTRHRPRRTPTTSTCIRSTARFPTRSAWRWTPRKSLPGGNASIVRECQHVLGAPLERQGHQVQEVHRAHMSGTVVQQREGQVPHLEEDASHKTPLMTRTRDHLRDWRQRDPIICQSLCRCSSHLHHSNGPWCQGHSRSVSTASPANPVSSGIRFTHNWTGMIAKRIQEGESMLATTWATSLIASARQIRSINTWTRQNQIAHPIPSGQRGQLEPMTPVGPPPQQTCRKVKWSSILLRRPTSPANQKFPPQEGAQDPWFASWNAGNK